MLILWIKITVVLSQLMQCQSCDCYGITEFLSAAFVDFKEEYLAIKMVC